MSDSLVRVSRRVEALRQTARSWGHNLRRGRVPRDPRHKARWATAVPGGVGVPAGGACIDRAHPAGRVQRGEDRAVRLLPTISRTISLSFQSSFHLSLTVLVRYRSRANI